MKETKIHRNKEEDYKQGDSKIIAFIKQDNI